jgi:hypothetical protein
MKVYRLALWLVLVAAWSLVAHVHAQPVADADPHASGHAAVGSDPHAGLEGAPQLERRPLTTAEPSKDVPPGTIRVRVLDGAERPVAGAAVEVGTMSQDSARTHMAGRSDAAGICIFAKLATGDRQAYRVNVQHDGAKYSATPFRLTADQGYDVVIRRLDTTRDEHVIVLYVGATSVEFKDDRLKLVQQARLFNVGTKTYVFPEGGLLVPLPPGALAFQSDEVMTDQKLAVDADHGFRVRGSIAPGEVTLTWGFDLPQSGSSADLTFQVPWPAFAYRVLADAAPGLSLEVDDMPPPELRADNGRHFFVTEVVKSAGEQPLRSVRIHLRGVPGPGPLRLIAVALALLVLGVGLGLAVRAPQVVAMTRDTEDFETRKRHMLQRATSLGAEHQRGEVGDEFHAAGMTAIEDDLAALLYEREKTHKPRSA